MPAFIDFANNALAMLRAQTKILKLNSASPPGIDEVLKGVHDLNSLEPGSDVFVDAVGCMQE